MRQTGAVHDVSVQHLQKQVIQRNHLLHLHAVEVVHAFVTTDSGYTVSGSFCTDQKLQIEPGYKLIC